MGLHRSEVGLQGNVVIEILDAHSIVHGPDGWPVRARVLERMAGHNLVTVAGMNQIVARLWANGVNPITHFAIGSGSNVATISDTQLQTELARAAVTRFVPSDRTLLVQYYLPSTSLNGSNLREFGLFNAASSGVMHARHVRASNIAKTADIAITFSWSLTYVALNIVELQYFMFGGDSRSFTRPSGSDSYPSGATFDKLVPGSTVWEIDSASLAGGTFVLEAIACVETAGARAKVCVVNLSDGAPDTALTGSEISFTADNLTGERKVSSAITFPAGGAAKKLGVKVTANSTTVGAAAWGCRIVRTS